MRIVLLIVLACMVTSAKAEIMPHAYASDPHIQVVTYDPDQVYRVSCLQGYTTAIEFSADEKILSVNIGDSSAWLVNVQGYLINLKPIADHPDTNMNVVTSRGTYEFSLTAPSRSDAHRIPSAKTVFLLRFRYSENQDLFPSKQSCQSGLNKCYSARGDRCVAPTCIYDDGKFTYFNFNGCKKIPAIFLVDCDRNESLVNYHLEGNYVVVETTGRQFTLRSGCHVASVFNEACNGCR